METNIVICPYSFNLYVFDGDKECPDCRHTHTDFKYIKGKTVKWYRQKNQWIRSDYKDLVGVDEYREYLNMSPKERKEYKRMKRKKNNV